MFIASIRHKILGFTTLPLIEIAVNTTINISMSHSPFELLYGEKLPLLIYIALLSYKKLFNKTIGNTHSKKGHLNNMEKAQNQQKHHYNKYNTLITFKVGEFVLFIIYNWQLTGMKKLSPDFIGPYKILR